jgi:hypothetical protein
MAGERTARDAPVGNDLPARSLPSYEPSGYLDRRIVGERLEDERLSTPSLLKSPPDRHSPAQRTGTPCACAGSASAPRLGSRTTSGSSYTPDDRGPSPLARARSEARTRSRRLRSPGGSLVLSEFRPKKRASLHVVQGEEMLARARRSGSPVQRNAVVLNRTVPIPAYPA